MKKGATKTSRVGGILLVFFFLFCIFALLLQSVQAVNSVAETVAVGSGPADVAVTPNGEYAYIANAGSDSVSVISTATDTTKTASLSSMVPEFSAQLLGIMLAVFMIIILSAVTIAKKKMRRASSEYPTQFNFFEKIL